MSDSDKKIEDATAASHQGMERPDVKRRALFGMISKSAFVVPVVASFALDALSVDKAHAASGNGSGIVSDRRLKRDVVRVGTHASGAGLYEFSYIGRVGRHTGVMAQEVLSVMPEAVILGADGFYRVNYTLLGA